MSLAEGETARVGEVDDSAVLCEITSGGVAVLSLNRPERLNTWAADIATEFYVRIDRADANPDVRAIVITGRGRAFCAGADMGSVSGANTLADGDPVDVGAVIGDRPPHFLMDLRKPVIAAINGACVGIGFTHALMCDVRFAAAGTKFAAPFARRGLIAEHGISWILPRVAGPGVARELLLSGRTFRAEEARDLGLVTGVVASEDLLAQAVSYAEGLAANCSPASLAQIKAQLTIDAEGGMDEATARAEELMAESLARPDVIEGITAFLEKRPPRFPPLA
ncbi:enoyl-CoA hydratase [Gordonia sp. LSe1-13]|uniref:Enoyl-CoA hydratase n=1 Tax=Gordonia sesuvii TaxID=3116777 RepID=A0ABU7M903_9ACTN|nr:enoyl-CoA hydratase [Gordonia sp. LSe1-13]